MGASGIKFAFACCACRKNEKRGIRMNVIELEYQIFNCRKANRNVIITLLKTGENQSRVSESAFPNLVAFDCNLKAQCGVFLERGDDKLYNWWACMHPGLSKQPSPTQQRQSPSSPPASVTQSIKLSQSEVTARPALRQFSR